MTTTTLTVAKTLVLATAVLSLAAGPSAASDATTGAAEPTAAAWLLDVTVSSGTANGVQVGTARAQSGPATQAWGAPVTVNGTSYQAAGATAAHPTASAASADWTDQTGSVTLTGGYTRATVGGGSAEVRTGVAAGSGSGFAMASQLLTWDQQKRLLDQFMALNDAVFDPLNARVQALRPVLEAAGLEVPSFTKMSALALINVGSGDVAGASAATASGAGMASAKATATLTGLQLLDGFVRLDGVQATADSQSVGGDEARTATVRIGQLSVAGIGVTLDQDGLQVAGTSALRKAVVQPAMDQLSEALKDNGITLAVDEVRSAGDLRQATAFRLSVAAPQQTLTVTVGHVEASASSVSGPLPVAEPAAPLPPAAVPPVLLPDVPPAVPVSDLGGTDVVAPPVTGGLPSTGDAGPPAVAARHGLPRWLGASPPAAVARALGTTFLLLLLAGVGTALIPVLLMRPRPIPRRLPLLDPEVLP